MHWFSFSHPRGLALSSSWLTEWNTVQLPVILRHHQPARWMKVAVLWISRESLRNKNKTKRIRGSDSKELFSWQINQRLLLWMKQKNSKYYHCRRGGTKNFLTKDDMEQESVSSSSSFYFRLLFLRHLFRQLKQFPRYSTGDWRSTLSSTKVISCCLVFLSHDNDNNCHVMYTYKKGSSSSSPPLRFLSPKIYGKLWEDSTGNRKMFLLSVWLVVWSKTLVPFLLLFLLLLLLSIIHHRCLIIHFRRETFFAPPLQTRPKVRQAKPLKVSYSAVEFWQFSG